jgi:hypothetical protein
MGNGRRTIHPIINMNAIGYKLNPAWQRFTLIDGSLLPGPCGSVVVVQVRGFARQAEGHEEGDHHHAGHIPVKRLLMAQGLQA